MGKLFSRLLKLTPYLIIGLSTLVLQTASVANEPLGLTFDAPILVTPENNSLTSTDNFPPLGIPTFSWQPVSGASLYHLQINSDQYFIQPNILDILTENMQFTPSAVSQFPDGVYYWRVRVEEPLPGSLFSLPFQFTKTWAISINAPALNAPANNTILAFFDAPSFSWDGVAGASTYRFQIASSPDNFSDPVYQQDTAALAHQPEEKLGNGVYFWRVIPLDPAGRQGTPSITRTFSLAYGSLSLDQIPMLLSPEQDAVSLFSPTFKWTAIPGAEIYRLEYSTGPVCGFTDPTIIETNQTSYTPTSQFPNQAYFCWRVRAESGQSIGSWSATGEFSRQWNLEAGLLTPTNGDSYTRSPVFNWTPVAGAAFYQIDYTISTNLKSIDFTGITANPFWVSTAELLPGEYSWQITPYDSQGHPGATSLPFTFSNPLTATVPALVYPLPYYLPDDPVYSGDADLNPVEERIAAYPLFIWQRVFNPSPYGGLLARAYRIQVSSLENFSQIIWQLDTQNTAATPTHGDFSPIPGVDYYWRVCPLDQELPVCQVNPVNGDEWWSETRRARFDVTLGPIPSNDDLLQLLRPVHGHEQVEGTPLLEWIPLTTASYYQVHISRDPNFETLAHEAYPEYPNYASPISLAQRNLGLTEYGTFYWRVRGVVDGEYTNWSEVRRFQIASQSEWRRSRVLGNALNKLLVGSDPTGDTNGSFDLSTLYISQSNQAWYFGFNATSDDSLDMTYILLIDTDHLDGSGGIDPPEGSYNLSTIPAHQPEYILYIDQLDGQISAHNTYIYTWTGSGWSAWQSLAAAGGTLIYVPGEPGYIEFELPDSAIGGVRAPDSIAAMIVSVNSYGIAIDSVPSDPEIPGTAVLSRFTSVSDRMNLIHPPNNPLGSQGAIPTMLPLYWDWPTGSDPTASDPIPATPFAGAQLQISLDPQFSSLLFDHIYTATSLYHGTPAAALTNDLSGDATYYWRVRPRYLNAGEYFGAWSAVFSFTRHGFVALNLRTNTTNATPEFRWDMVQGASQYQFQVSQDNNFDLVILDITTPANAYTPLNSLPPGTYYWRVGVLRESVNQSVWSLAEAITLTLPTPAGLSPDDSIHPVETIPTLCWQPVTVVADSLPIATAWKYRLQVSPRVDFLTLTDSIDTEMHCWTPSNWYPQGRYYWRIATIDSSGNPGPFSPPASFLIQYPTTTLLSPISGWAVQTPGFAWTVVPGAACYRLEVSISADFYTPLDSILTNSIQYTPTFSYPTGQIYYWRVGMYNADGHPGTFIDSQITIGSPRTWLPMVRR